MTVIVCMALCLSMVNVAMAHPNFLPEWQGFNTTSKTSPADSYKSLRTRAIQLILQQCAEQPNLDVDGSFGSGTHNAVVQFQTKTNCNKLNGIVGPETWGKLYDELGIGAYDPGHYWYYTGTDWGGGEEPEMDIIRRGDPSGRWQVYNSLIDDFSTFEFAS